MPSLNQAAPLAGHRVVEPAGPPQYSRLDQPRLGVLWLRPPRPGDQYARGIAVPLPSKHESDAEVRSKGHRIAGEYLLVGPARVLESTVIPGVVTPGLLRRERPNAKRQRHNGSWRDSPPP